MEYMGYRHGYPPNYESQGYVGQQPQHGIQGYAYGVSYEQQQIVLAQLQQQQRQAVMMGHGGMPPGKPNESKPRLAKEEVELLESEFGKNPKPNSSLKRDLADQMRVDVARINNWFQNRRAKAKQIKKTQEYEAQQAAERSGSDAQSTEDDEHDVVSEFYDLSNHSQPMQASSAPFNNDDESLDHEVYPLSDEEEGEEEEEEDEAVEDDSATNSVPASLPVQPVSSIAPEDVPLPSDTTPSDAASEVSHMAHYSSSPVQHFSQSYHEQTAPSSVDMSQQSSCDGLPLAHVPTFDISASHPAMDQTFAHPMHDNLMGSFNLAMSTFPSQLLPLHTRLPEQTSFQQFSSPEQENITYPSPIQQQSLSPPDALRRSSPPRMDLATRRNLRRPTQLTSSALRSCSFGPRTGLDGPARSDSATPMRRIASATGPISTRIQKPSAGSAPRSPMFLERTKEALLHSLQQSRRSSPTPSDAVVYTDNTNNTNNSSVLEAETSSTTSDDEQLFIMAPSYFSLDPSSIKTPPSTPGIQIQFPTSNNINSHNIDATWSYIPTDEPLVTPGLGSFGSEIDFPSSSSHITASGYAISQPPTPSFPPPSHHMAAQMQPFYPMYHPHQNLAALDCKFPDTFQGGMVQDGLVSASARSSPTIPASMSAVTSKSYQFAQNVTPQDFNHPTGL